MPANPLIIPYFLNQAGCPRRCIFCNQQVIVGSEEGGQGTLEEVVAAYCQSWGGTTKRQVQLAFYGGSFTSLPLQQQQEYLLQAWRYLQQGTVQRVRLSTRPDALEKVCVEHLQRYGVDIVELGVQSLDDQVLAASNRGHNAAAAIAAVKLLQEYDFTVGIQLMVGLPLQHRASFFATLETVIGLRPAFIRLYPALVLAGTRWATCWHEPGYTPLPLPEAVSWCADALCLCRAADIPVVRMGLHPSGGLDRPGNVVAGPYHQAFGELVKSYLFREKVVDMVRKGVLDKQSRLRQGKRTAVSFGLHVADISAFIGHQRSNMLFFAQQFQDLEIGWHVDRQVCRGEFACMVGRRSVADRCSIFVPQG
ncbi:MAG: radical SAM protein [Deltaproteobacteria bacterium]|nr:radical SAM protein [Candidatus Anaeroferrophillus wilburensis]MBN2889285.1 radical SAM protein [Deltaproteobacteria bacterium]